MHRDVKDEAESPNKFCSLKERLAARALRLAEFKQRLLYACSRLPPNIRKPVQKILWPPPLMHMRYVPPSVVLRPVEGGIWNLQQREDQFTQFVSRPLAELRKFTTQPVIVIATGPSANDCDWSELADGRRLIWAVNGAPTLLAKHDLKCDYLVVTDHRFARDGAEHIVLAAERGAVLCFSYEAAAGFAATRPDVLSKTPFYVFEKATAWYGLPLLSGAELKTLNEKSGCPFYLRDDSKPGVGWSHDPELGVFAGRTVAFAALQLIVWSGARDIEVMGLDLGSNGRAYDEAAPVVSHLERDYQDYIRPAFECMAAALSGRGIRIINHSPISPLQRDLVPLP